MKPTFIALLMCLCLPASGAGSFVGKVTSVADGDTITVTTSDKKQFKIRLEGTLIHPRASNPSETRPRRRYRPRC